MSKRNGSAAISGAAAVFAVLAAQGCDVGQSSPHMSSGTGGGGASATTGSVSSGGGAGGAPSSTSSTGASMGGAGPSSSSSISSSSSGGTHPMAPNGYYVAGNGVLDANDKPHLFHGVARPSFEWNPAGEHITLSDLQLMKGWGANVVRFALNQDFWLPNAAKHDGSYQSNVDTAIQQAHVAGLDVILDLHWSDRGDLNNGGPGQQRMADQNSITFWADVAAKYKGDGRVIFELYNEPHDVPWDVWLNGGPSGDGFTAAGMQQLYTTVRSAGADNLVIVNGLDWAFDLSGVPNHRVQGYNIMYATHPYDQANKQPSDWDKAFGSLSSTDPVIATEYGTTNCSTGYYSQLIQYADAHKVSWTAWAWYPGGCNFPALINDWSGAPNGPGQIVKAALGAYPP